MLSNNKNKKNKILIISPSSEISRKFLSKFVHEKSIVSISRKKFFHRNIDKNLVLSSRNNISRKKLINFFKNYKFNLAISFIADQSIKNLAIQDISSNKILQILNTNAVFPIKLMSFLLENNNFSKNSKILFFSSRSGSIAERGTKKHHISQGNHVYRASKSLLNSFIKNLAFQNKNKNKIIVSYDPGWIKTKSSGGGKFTSEKAAKDLYKFIIRLRQKHNGKFLNYNFTEIKW